eukprot:COSAG02_NODE_1263_length_13548_cov_13.881627_5_plen_454_part_00
MLRGTCKATSPCSGNDGQRARVQGTRDALHALLYQATRATDGQSPLVEGTSLTAVELEIVDLIRAEPSLCTDCVEFISKVLQDDSSVVLLKASRIFGIVLSGSNNVRQCARRLDDLIARLTMLSSSYQIPMLPVEDEPDELLRGSSFEGQFRSVRAGGMDLLIDLSSCSVSRVEDGEVIGNWDNDAGMVRLARDEKEQEIVRRTTTALLADLKSSGGKRAVASSMQQVVASVGGGVASVGGSAAATLADEVGSRRVRRPPPSWQDGKHTREQGAQDALHAMLYQATSYTSGETLDDDQGSALTAAELEIVTLIRAQPSLSADCVDFLARSLESDNSVVLLKAARVLGVAISADGSSSIVKSSPLHIVKKPESVADYVRRSSALVSRMMALRRYVGAQKAESIGANDGSLKFVRAKGIDYVVDTDSFLTFLGEEEVGICMSHYHHCKQRCFLHA